MLSQIVKIILTPLLVLFFTIPSKGQYIPRVICDKDQLVIDILNTNHPVTIDAANFELYCKIENPKMSKPSISVKKMTIVNINTNYNVTIDFKKNKKTGPVKINLSHADTLKLIGSKRNIISLKGVYSAGKHTNCILIDGPTLSTLDLSYYKLKSLIINNSNIFIIDLSNGKVDNVFSLSNTRLRDTKFDLSDLPDTISMYSVKLETVSKNIDLTRIKNKEESYNFERTLKISNTDLDKIDLNYGRFNFHVEPKLEIRNARWIYEKIIWHCQKYGLLSKVRYYSDALTEIEDRDSKLSITNLVNSLYWSRGQNKTRAVIITFVIFLAFFILNCKYFEALKRVYYPKSFKEYFQRIDRIDHAFTYHPSFTKERWSKRRSKLAHFSGVFFYSGLIFWNIKIDIENLRLNNVPLCFFILFQHLIGLLFIANIVGFIIIGS